MLVDLCVVIYSLTCICHTECRIPVRARSLGLPRRRRPLRTLPPSTGRTVRYRTRSRQLRRLGARHFIYTGLSGSESDRQGPCEGRRVVWRPKGGLEGKVVLVHWVRIDGGWASGECGMCLFRVSTWRFL